MKEKTNMERFMEKKAGATRLSDFSRRVTEFFKGDEMRYIVLFDMIAESDRSQCETLEQLLLKTRETTNERIPTILGYTQRELDIIDFFLDVVNCHFRYGLKDNIDVSPAKQPDGFGVVNI